ncbi:marvel domain-containing protein [Xylariomycetidae sp. FL0641]|nr:marvel domain-containing protein [Xylariomycetidae sp. FL0641]
MRNMIDSVLRLVQFLLVLIITALIGNVIATNGHAAGSAESSVNFIMFVCALVWLAVLYALISAFVAAAAFPIISLALDALSLLFTFIGAIVLAAKLGGVNCGSWHNRSHNWIAYGSNDPEGRCREIQASDVFLWFLFATFCASLFFVFKEYRRSGGSMSRPSMSQIGV